jgi:predicted alpha/beta superfamily hydrolase
MPPPSRTGIFRRHEPFRSALLGQNRTVWVSLPSGYTTGRARYPVLYLHDGQNVFDGARSFIPGQEWGVDETAQRLIRAGRIEPLIVVGIDNAGSERIAEYTPTPDRRYGGGGAARYGRMLTDELKPFIDRTYRTRPAPADTGLGGASLGGLVTLALGLSRPDVFGRLAVLSPSVWWDERQVLRQVDALPRRTAARIWLDIGTGEGERAVTDARLLRDALRRKGWRLGTDLAYVEADGARHNEAAWAARVDPILRYLFPATRVT